MSDEDGHQARGFGIELPAGLVRAIAEGHDHQQGRAEDRHNLTMSWLDGLDVEGLLALRWILFVAEPDGAYGNNQRFDGMCYQLLRAKGVDPLTGLDPAAQLLEAEALRSKGRD